MSMFTTPIPQAPTRKAHILHAVRFGDFGRFLLTAILDRFGDVWFHVTDAENIDELGLPALIRQSPTASAALAGLFKCSPEHDAEFERVTRVVKTWKVAR